MNPIQNVKRSVQSMTPRQRYKLYAFMTLQIFVSMLDITGVLLMGLLVLQIQDIGLSGLSPTTSSTNWALPSNYLGLSQSESLLLLLLMSVFCFSLKAILAPSLQKRLLIFLGGIATKFSQDMTLRLFSQDIVFTQKRTTQESAFVLTSATFLAFQGVLGFFALLISEFAIVVSIVIVLLSLNLYLTLFLIAYFFLILFFLNQFSKKIIEKQTIILNMAAIGATTAVQETIKSYREVFVSQRISSLLESLTINLEKSINARASLTWVSLIPKYILDTSLILGIAIIGGITYMFDSPEKAVTFVGIFLLSASRMLPSLLRFNSGLQGIQNCSDATKYLFDLVEDLEITERKFDQVKSTSVSQTGKDSLIAVDSLNFKYQGSTDLVLKNLSFDVKKGEFLAVVGPSGSGKSTLVDLLIGVIDDPTRSIRIGDLSPRENVQKSPGQIGYVAQNVALFTRSLLENIGLGVPVDEIDYVRVERSIERSALSDFIKTIPLGLNTLVGENGYNLSGGQKQRIGIARALYNDPEILIFDEATSALDAETEHQISQMLSSLVGELTLIVVAHRLATVQKADRVLYLGSGGFSAIGTFEELRNQVSDFDAQAKLSGL